MFQLKHVLGFYPLTASVAGGFESILYTGIMLITACAIYITAISSNTAHHGNIILIPSEGILPINFITALVTRTAGSDVYEVSSDISIMYDCSMLFLEMPRRLYTVSSSLRDMAFDLIVK